MKQYLFNLALIDTIEFCKANKIDPSGTHLTKYPYRQTYALLRDSDGLAIVTTSFHRNGVPTHSIHHTLHAL